LYPYVLDNSSLHFFDDYGVLFTDVGNFVLSDVETYLIQKFTGNNSIDDIIVEISKEIDCSDYDKIKTIVMTFIKDKPKFIFLSENINKVEFITNGEKGSRIPFALVISLTNRCNEKCVHCFKNCCIDNNDSLDFDILMETLNYLKGKSTSIQLTGGEPLLHDKFFSILKYCSDNFDTTITTNASLINSHNAVNFKNVKTVQISLYSHIKSQHDKITGVEGSFDKTINGITSLLKEGIPVVVSTILNNKNYNSMEDFSEFCCNIGVKHLRYGLFMPFGRGTALKNTWCVPDKTNKLLSEKINILSEKYKNKLSIQTWNDEDKYTGLPYNYKCFGCGAGLFTWSISERGIIKPCELLDDEFSALADLKKQKINNIVKTISLDNLPSQLANWNNVLKSKDSSIMDICSNIKNYYINNCLNNKMD